VPLRWQHVRRVNHEPVALDFMSFSGKGFHIDFLINDSLKMVVLRCPVSTHAADSALYLPLSKQGIGKYSLFKHLPSN
jgi:hypothetical protein